MGNQRVFEELARIGILPVIRTDVPGNVGAAITALIESGLPVAEITMTVPDAIAVMGECSKRFGDRAIVGAGSVTTVADCEKAIAAGCRFVVTPTVNTDVIATCGRAGICVIGGGLTPSEILTVWQAGADAVKVFPAKAMGGAAYIRMLQEPLPHIPLVPTGGVNLDTLEEFITAGARLRGAGGDLAGKALIDAGDTEAIARRARQYADVLARSR